MHAAPPFEFIHAALPFEFKHEAPPFKFILAALLFDTMHGAPPFKFMHAAPPFDTMQTFFASQEDHAAQESALQRERHAMCECKAQEQAEAGSKKDNEKIVKIWASLEGS